MTKIINWKTKEVIIEDENLSMEELIITASNTGIPLIYADLRGANLCGNNLIDLFLHKADVRGANFKDTILGRAVLTGDLRGANFKGADIWDVDLRGAKINKDQVDDLLIALGVEIV